MRYFVTGGAGFIGSNMVDRLLSEPENEVVAYDNFSTGRREFLEDALKNPRFTLVEGDTLDLDKMTQAMKGCEFVFHFAANADVRMGCEHPKKDLEQNTIATFNVLEAMRANDIKRIGFSSTGSVYGEAEVIPTPENAPFPVQTSLYGASKLACEGLLAAYAEGFGYTAYIFRFVSILGERYTHGHVFDFCKRLKDDPSHLHILGDGHQKKSYLYVKDCMEAILTVVRNTNEKVNIYNLGTDEYVEVNDSVRFICGKLGVKPEFTYAGGERGWIGDNPFIYLDTKKVRSLGWAPKATIEEGVIKTVEYLTSNPWVFEARD
ncbi:MAG: NAD-dependent epimerase/dehydratase family protein [Lachnospiraceae bacterium]|nr:NAD-dependent epimerase/dehydratase family protein [Lachnospiraceae bacterium]MBR6486853.1 NAD-dependent epimerase/dehydratase family protein [Lachnospiraceae bacterium]